MMQRMKGTLRPGRKAGVLALAVLLLTCVLMAGAVSATEGEVTVNTYDELVANLLDSDVTKITLDNDIDAEGMITISRDVTIDGSNHIIGVDDSKKGSWPEEGSNKDLIQITGDVSVVLENITLHSEDTAFGLQAYHDSSVTKLVTLKNVVLTNSSGSGLNVNGGNVSLINVTIQNSGWQSVDVSANEEGASSSFMMDSQSKLRDEVEINTDKPTKTVTLNLPSEYPKYSFFYDDEDDDEGYDEKKLVWSTNVDAAAEKIAESKGVTFNATVQNSGDPLAYHADFLKAMSAAEDGATVTQLEKLTLTEPITINKAITFDGSKKEIIGSSTEGYFLMVAVPLDGNEGEQVTLQNLILDIKEIGSNANLGGITVCAPSKVQSVPVTLKDSIVDMGDVDMTGTTSMNPAVYFVNASNSQIINNEITAGAASSSSTRCVVLDGGEGSTVTGNKLHLGPTSSKEGSMGVQIKGSSTRNTVSGNTFIAPNDANTDCRAVEITAVKDKDISSSITGNTINFPGQDKSSAVRVVLSSIDITEENTAVPITLTIENNKGSVKSEVSFWKSESATVKQSYINLEGNKYNPSLTKTEEYTMDAGFSVEGAAQPSTGSVTNNNPNPPVSDGNMNNAYRVLFNDGSTTLSVQTDLSSGDKLTKPETPVKDGYTFAGWYKDSACTQAWDFETGIPGDMTLYAKWTAAGSSGETEATATPTATAVTTPQPTKTQTAAATTSAPQATTAAGVSPTLTQAPAPVAGALFGLLAAGVLLRRRFQ